MRLTPPPTRLLCVLFVVLLLGGGALDGVAGAGSPAADPETEATLSVGQQFSLAVAAQARTVETDVEDAEVEVRLESTDDGRQAVVDERIRTLDAEAADLARERAALLEAFRAGELSREAFVARLVALELRADATAEQVDRLRVRARADDLDGSDLDRLAGDLDASSSPALDALLAGVRADPDGTLRARVEARETGVRLEIRVDDGRVRVDQTFDAEDDSTAVVLDEAAAVDAARGALATDAAWRVERVDLRESAGVYEVRFVGDADAEARVRVDASSGAVLVVDERVERTDDERENESDGDGDDRETDADDAESEPGDSTDSGARIRTSGDLDLALSGATDGGDERLERGGRVVLVATRDGEPVVDAPVYVEDSLVGRTDGAGRLSFVLPDEERVTVVVGAGDASSELRVDFD